MSRASRAQDPERLHRQLREYNQRERLARRSPTPEEVADWVEQARRLPVLVTYAPAADRATAQLSAGSGADRAQAQHLGHAVEPGRLCPAAQSAARTAPTL